MVKDKIFASLIGGAIGDAMGGPVEMLDWDEIKEKYGVIDTLLYYENVEPNPHGPFKKDAGTYTDDTRFRNLIVEAIINKQGYITEFDLGKYIIEYFHNSKEKLEAEWIEEYYYKVIYKDKKEMFGGQPANGGVMSAAIFGTLYMCDPVKAFQRTFDDLFISNSYARYAAGLVAAMVAASYIEGITVNEIIDLGMDAMRVSKRNVEGPLWINSDLYFHVALENERLIADAMEIALRYDDVYSDELRKELYEKCLQKYKYDGSETVAIVIAMLLVSKGNFKKAITGAVCLGRDNDSSATVLGSICGAMHGSSVIDKEYIDTVEKVNFEFRSFKDQAEKLYDILVALTEEEFKILKKRNLIK